MPVPDTEISGRQVFDIVFAADFRRGDTDSRLACETLDALAEAGFRVGVVSVIGDVVAEPFKIEPLLMQLCSRKVAMLDARTKASCALLIAFDLRLFRKRPAAVLDVTATQRLVLCRKADLRTPDDLLSHLNHACETLGGDVVLAPVAAPVRAHLMALRRDVQLTQHDWPPTVRKRRAADGKAKVPRTLPTVGFVDHHTTDEGAQTRDIIRAHPNLGLLVLDPSETDIPDLLIRSGPVSLMGRTQEFDLFCDSDFVVTGAAAAQDPWPEMILEALAHGCVPVLPADYHQMFFAAALYAKPKDVPTRMITAWDNQDHLEDLRTAGAELIKLRLAPEHLVQRVVDLIGRPAKGRPAAPPITNKRRIVLSLTSNGVGMGHLTRQIAIARRLPDSLQPVFLSFSQAVGVVAQFGWVGEYLPYHTGPKMDRGYWNEWLADALEHACDFYGPAALMLDCNLPFDGIGLLHDRRPDVPLVWVRRAMWGAGRDLDAIEKRPWFDAILEPGEYAENYDRGPTVEDRQHVRRVSPVTLLEASELLPRADALRALGLCSRDTNILILPGALNNTDTRSFWHELTDLLRDRPDVQVVVGAWQITEADDVWPAGVKVIKGYPFSQWFRAFDFAVSTAGYNSFHELIGYQVPTVFVPNENPLMDRQDLRATYAARNRLALILRSRASESQVKRVIAQIQDGQVRSEMKARAQHLFNSNPQNGAATVAEIITQIAGSLRANRTFF